MTVKALPKMKRAEQSQALNATFEKASRGNGRPYQAFPAGVRDSWKIAARQTCDTIEGMVFEGDEIIEEFKDVTALDAGLISTAQAVENCEIARRSPASGEPASESRVTT